MPSVLVITVVHHPLDARIWHRQIAALLEHGWQVTYAAPWSAYSAAPQIRPGLTPVDLPRAVGRRRIAAQWAARRVLRECGATHDVVLLHDPELLLTIAGLDLPPVVWDVHEDVAAAVEVRSWIPRRLRRPTASALQRVERWAEARVHLILADRHYADRFSRVHPVVLNTTQVVSTPVPAGIPDDQGRQRVVYLGSLTMERGARELVEVGRRLGVETAGKILLEVVGPAHGEAAPLLAASHAAGDLIWSGFVPNPEALLRLDGALAGLSLLHDTANFRPSMPTKIVEYLAHGVPVITTPLPVAVDLVTRSRGGVVVPFGDVHQTVRQLLSWFEDLDTARATGRRGHELVAREYDWSAGARQFVGVLEAVAASPA